MVVSDSSSDVFSSDLGEQASFTDTVGSFTDTNTAKTAGDFTVSIDWGDATTSAGTVSGSGGSFSVARSEERRVGKECRWRCSPAYPSGDSDKSVDCTS